MPVFSITLSDGRKVKVEADNQQEAASFVMANHAKLNPVKANIKPKGVKLPPPVSAGLIGLSDAFNFNTTDEEAGKSAVARYQGGLTAKAAKKAFKGNFKEAAEYIDYAYLGKGKQLRKDVKSKATETARGQIAKIKAENPIAYYGANVVGGVALPVGGSSKVGVGLLKNASQAAKTGGLMGALYGAGDAVEGNRLKSAAIGGVSGAALGGALSVGGKLVKQGANRVLVKVKGAKSPQVEPARKILKTIGGDKEKVISKANELTANFVPNVNLIDTNSKLARLTGSIARSDIGGDARTLAAKKATAMLMEVPTSAKKMIKTINKQQRTKGQIEKDLLGAKLRYQGKIIRPIEDRLIDLQNPKVMQAPLIQEPIKETIKSIKSNSLIDNSEPIDAYNLQQLMKGGSDEFTPQQLGIDETSFKPELSKAPSQDFISAEPNSLSLKALEALRQRIDASKSAAYNKDNSPLARDLQNISDAIYNPIRKQIPQYDKMLNVGSAAKSQIDAMDLAGSDLFSKDYTDVKQYLDAASRREQIGYKQGTVDKLANHFINDSNKWDTLRRIGGGQDFDQKLRLILGDNVQSQMASGTKALNQRVEAARALNPNFGSQTAERLQDDIWSNIPTSKAGVISKAVDWTVSKLSGFTPEEKAAFVELATNPLNKDAAKYLNQLKELAEIQGLELPPILNSVLGYSSGISANQIE